MGDWRITEIIKKENFGKKIETGIFKILGWWH
jgi:hypothetical protein